MEADMIRWIAMTALVLIGVSCCNGVDQTVTKGDLMKADQAFAADTARRGLAGWMDWFAEDAVIFPQDEPAVRGKEAMAAYYAKSHFDPTRLTWQPVDADVSADGTAGMTWGTWQFTMTDEDGTEHRSSGKYLTAWHRQDDGSWKVTADMGIFDAD